MDKNEKAQSNLPLPQPTLPLPRASPAKSSSPQRELSPPRSPFHYEEVKHKLENKTPKLEPSGIYSENMKI